MTERTTACWICLGEAPPDLPGGRYHRACVDALFGVSDVPAVAFDRLTVTTWAEEHSGRLSISGYQPKGPAALDESGTRLVLVEKDSTHIVKPPHPQYLYINENEHLTMRLARAVGLDVAEHGLVELSDGSIAYVTKRFDRPAGAKGPRLHAFDFCQLAGKDPTNKEDSTAEECASIALQYGGPSTTIALFRLFVFADWVRNGDLHLKNLMMMEAPNGGYALTPAYDLLCTEPYGSTGLMLPVGGERKNVTRKIWLSFAEAYCQIERLKAAELIDSMLERLPDALALVDRSAFPHAEWKNKYKHFLAKKTRHLAGKA
ncbi:MAG: HipA domain-containing protein [Polyangiaceae bacterium]|nr:HipA domain-containing protein [Polyangiaceae bacterium]